MPEQNGERIMLVCECGQKMKAPAEAVGQRFKCVRCGAAVVVPAPANAQAGPAPASAPVVGDGGDRGDEQLAALLLDSGALAPEKLEKARIRQQALGAPLYQVLVGGSLLGEEELHALLSRQPGTATIDLKRAGIDWELMQLVPLDFVKEHWLLPIDRLGRLLTIAMVCPLDHAAIEAVAEATGLRVRAVLCRKSALDGLIDERERRRRASIGLGLIASAAEKAPRPEAARTPAASTAPTEEAHAEAPQPAMQEMTQQQREAVERLRLAIERLEQLPVSAGALREANAAAGQGAGAKAKVLALCYAEPALAAAVLQRANRAAFGAPGEVASLPLALALLGREPLQKLLAGLPSRPPAVEAALEPVLRAAPGFRGMAGRLASELDLGVGESIAETAAAMMPLGTLALAAAAPEAYGELDAGLDLWSRAEAEHKALGLAHTDAAAILGRAWGLPALLTDALTFFPRPEHAPDYARELAALLCVAHAAAVDSSTEANRLESALEILQLGQTRYKEIAAGMRQHASAS